MPAQNAEPAAHNDYPHLLLFDFVDADKSSAIICGVDGVALVGTIQLDGCAFFAKLQKQSCVVILPPSLRVVFGAGFVKYKP